MRIAPWPQNPHEPPGSIPVALIVAAVADEVRNLMNSLAAVNGFDPEQLKDLPREEALRSFVQQQLRPLHAHDDMSRYVRIFAWENVHPSKVLRKFITTNATPYLARAAELVRRFLPPDTSDTDAACAAIWLMGQCSIFVRNRDQFVQPPFNLKIDESFVEQLTDLVCGLALKGLARAA